MSTATLHTYAKGELSRGSKLVNLNTDSLKAALLASYTVGATLSTAQYQADVITAGVGVETTAGHGYSTGGVALTSVAWATTAANSWSVAWAGATPHIVGDIVIPTSPNGYLYQCVVAGTTSGSAPTWTTTPGLNVTDGGVTWVNIGVAVTTLQCANIAFGSIDSTGFVGAFVLLYDAQPGSAATNPLLGYYDLGGTLATGSGSITVTIPNPGGILAIAAS
ncbi:MAG: hypothetical protein ACRDYC_05640 [Acidimicrobiales bacterium]